MTNKDIRDYINFYRDLGFSFIPLVFGQKRPKIKEWSSYQNRKPTEDEISEWLKEPVNIGVVCGKVSGNLVVIDFDKPENYNKFFEKEIEEKTLVVKTSKGIHVYVKTAIPVASFKIPDLGIDVQAEGKYVVAPPSTHPSGHIYEFVNPEVKDVIIVTDLEEALWNKAEKLGVKRPESLFVEKGDLPCIKVLLKGVEKGIRNEAAIRLAAYWLFFKHETQSIVWELINRWNKRNRPPLEKGEIKNVMKSALKGGYEYGCPSMKTLGVCTPELEKVCPIKNKLSIKWLKIVKAPFAELTDGRLIEQGYDGKKVYFLIYDPKTEKVTKEDVVVNGETRYEPIMNDDVKNNLVFLPSDATEYDTDEKLTNETREFLDYWHEQNDRFQREFDVHYARTTYIYDLLPQICYRRALARFGRGKTTWLEVMGTICYRGMILAGCDTVSALRRTFHTWRGTAIIDEADFSKSDLYTTIIKILNIGWSRLLGWHKMADESDPYKTIASNVYGGKLLTTRKRFEDIALESRCATFISRENIEKKPLYRNRKFLEQAQKLRNKYLMWRFRNYHKLKERIHEIIEDPEICKEIYGEHIDVKSRVLQIVAPLGLVASKELKQKLVDFAHSFDEQLDALDPDTQFQKDLENVLKELIDQAETVDRVPRKIERYERYERSLYYPMRKILLKDIAIGFDPALKEDKNRNRLSGLCRKLSNFFRDEFGFHIEPHPKLRTNEVYLPAYYVRKIKEKTDLQDFAGHDNSTSRTPRTSRPPVFTAIPYSEGMPFCEICGQLQAMWYWEKQDKKVCVCDKCKREILRGEKHGD